MDIKYAAGLFDGEGCIGIDSRGNLRVWINATYKPVIEQLQAAFGGSARIHYKRTAIRKPSFRWVLSCNQAACFLQQAEPYLREKRAQALVALEYQSRKNHKRGRQVKYPFEAYRSQLSALKGFSF